MESVAFNALAVFSLVIIGFVLTGMAGKFSGVGFSRAPLVVVGFFCLINISVLVRFLITDIGVVQFLGEVILYNIPLLVSWVVFSRERFFPGAAVIDTIFVMHFYYVALNVLLYLFGYYQKWSVQFVEDYSSGAALMLSYVNIEADRIGFYLSNGINSFGPPLSLLAGAAYFSRRNVVYKCIASLLVFFCVLMIDSRSTVFYMLVALVASHIFRFHYMRNWLPVFLVSIPFLPFLIGFVDVFLGQSDIFSAVSSRGSSGGSLSGRDIIWGAIYLHFSTFDLMHVFGYGAMGQYASGISSTIGMTDEFSNYANVEYLSAHNQYLQNLINYGYIGLIFYIYMMIKLVKFLKACILKDEYSAGFMIYFISIILMFSNTETPIIYPGQLYFAFCILLVHSEMFVLNRGNS
jgi:O-antigen ligase